jgi:hypothetical protein
LLFIFIKKVAFSYFPSFLGGSIFSTRPTKDSSNFELFKLIQTIFVKKKMIQMMEGSQFLSFLSSHFLQKQTM